MASNILDPNFLSIEDILTKRIFNIPIYQRPYSWGEAEVKTLITDIFNAYDNNNKEYQEYYMGNIIIFDREEKIKGAVDKYDIIDGQQRLVTFSLMLLAIYCLAIEKGINGVEIADIKKVLWKYIGREYDKNLRVIQINGIEKKSYDDLFDECYDKMNIVYSENDKVKIIENGESLTDKKTKISNYCNKYQTKTTFEANILENFLKMYNEIDNKYGKNINSLMDFADYVLQYMKIIQIEARCNEKDVFSMFESINSKGKILDDIDKIKSYIFSVLEPEAYDKCSKTWGKLIIDTNDKLYNYLYIYIRAYITYYRQSFTVEQFKNLCETKLKKFYKTDTISDTVKKLLEELDNKVEKYKLLFSVKEATNIIKKTDFRFYYAMFVNLGYEHPRALFFRLFNELDSENISEDDAKDIIIATTLFMLKFKTIFGKDSKDSINVFSKILNYTYLNGISKQNVINEEESLLKSQNITDNTLIEQLNTLDAYSSKNFTVPLLALISSAQKKDNDIYKPSYDQAYEIYNSFSEVFSLDHLLVKTPNEKDNNFGYYKEQNNGVDILRLKEQHDFPTDLISDGMSYDEFTKLILNRIGNLRIMYKDKNSARQNDAIKLENEEIFNFTSIKKRSNTILKRLTTFLLPKFEMTIEKENIKKRKAPTDVYKEINMKYLIDNGEISINDRIYITVKPENSLAILIDENHVLYNGRRITLQEWGLEVTKWQAINIYQYCAIEGELETLQDKRNRLIQ